MKTVIIVQARMTSTRLPGKILKEVLQKPLLEYQLERLRRVRNTDELVIATTTNDTDLPIIDFCSRYHIKFFRGSEEDVLARYYLAASAHEASNVVRITSDCPLIDPDIIDQVIQTYMDNQATVDYVSNTLIRTYPRGMDTEVFSFSVLEEAYRKALLSTEREHVTPYIYGHDRFRIKQVTAHNDLSKHRWTVDTPEDYELIRRIIEAIYPVNPVFTMQDVVNLLEQHPQWVEINSSVEQKSVH